MGTQLINYNVIMIVNIKANGLLLNVVFSFRWSRIRSVFIGIAISVVIPIGIQLLVPCGLGSSMHICLLFFLFKKI